MDSFLALDIGRALFVGKLDDVSLHQAAADAVLVGLDGEFELHCHGRIQSLEATVVPAHTVHRLNVQGGRLAVLYLEPGCRILGSLEKKALREALEATLEKDDNDTWLKLLQSMRVQGASSALDARVARVVARLNAAPERSPSVDDLATGVGLSVSHLEHSFKAQLGVPLRGYRKWQRLRMAAAQVVKGKTLTEAAHAAGFYDSAHFAKAFRMHFGVSPSTVLNAHLKGRVVGA